MSITFTSFGAAMEVTGSKHMFTVGDHQVLIDCGMFQGRREESYQRNRNLPFDPGKLSDVILSHGHFDHCGNLPSLVLGGYEGSIQSTPATRDIANLIMMDSAHIMKKDSEWLRRKAPDKKVYPPIYQSRDVLETLTRFVTVNYHRQFRLNSGLLCQFHDAGHILGSSMIVLEDSNSGCRIAFTGDLGRSGMPILRDPDPLPPVDYLLCDSTYGNRLHDPIGDAQQQLGEVIRNTAERGGKIIIPSFAVGRTQELIYFLHLLKDDKAIPDLNIYVDSPMAVNATSIFRVHQECYEEKVHQAFLDHHKNPFGFTNLNYVTEVKDSKRINDHKEPCIIISSSGMCEAGRILHHLKNNIGDSSNTVLIVGYMAENTLGRALAERRRQVTIFGNKYDLRARVKILNTFSAHADYREIAGFVKRMDLNRLKQVFLVHGEKEPATHLAGVLREAGIAKATPVEPGLSYTLNK